MNERGPRGLFLFLVYLYMRKKYFFLFVSITFIISCFGQSQIKRALFIGNSYTYVNNLPQMIADMADAGGDSLIFDSSTPGGYTLQLHSTNSTTLSKIMQGNWDYVVLQEQSQLPSFNITQVTNSVFPYAKYLDSLIHVYSPCAETIFYMTWGRKYGDASNCSSWPPVCTYEGMDSLLNLRYNLMADSNKALLSPVGEVWRYLRLNFPSIELYQTDNSHPSNEGTFAAACSFYSVMYQKNPMLNAFNSTLNSTDAMNIKLSAKNVVFDSLQKYNVGAFYPQPSFTYNSIGSGQIQFTNQSSFANNYQWNFGDGNFSNFFSPTHTFTSNGTYIIELIAEKCGKSDTIRDTIQVNTVGIKKLQEENYSVYPNPAQNNLTLDNALEIGTQFYISNSNGVKVYEGVIREKKQTVDIRNLESGVYFIHLQNKKAAIRIIKLN